MRSSESNGKLDVVTGGAGFIGSHLVDALIECGRQVLAIDNLSAGRLANLARHRTNPRFRFATADVTDRPTITELFAGADRVFHLAALVDNVGSSREPDRYFAVNVGGSHAVAEAARLQGARQLIYAASAACYGLCTDLPMSEDTPIDARFPYGLTKYLGEQALLCWGGAHGLSVSSLRLFNVYGARGSAGEGGAVLGTFLAQRAAGKPLTIVGDGTQTRDFVHVADVVRAFCAVASHGGKQRVYNVGSGVEVSINRLSELVGAEATITLPRRPGEAQRVRADTTRIATELGWQPRVQIETGVAELLAGRDGQGSTETEVAETEIP